MTRSGRERADSAATTPPTNARRRGGPSDFELDERRDVGRVARGVVCVEYGAARLTVTAQVDVPHVTTQVTHDLTVREPAARQTVKEDDRRCVRIADAIEGEGLSGSQGGEHRSERYDQRVIRDDLSAAVRASLAALGVDPPAEIVLERPRVPEHGDWSTNVALATAKAAGRNPRELASELAASLIDAAHPPRRDRRGRRARIRQLPPARHVAPRGARATSSSRASTATPSPTRPRRAGDGRVRVREPDRPAPRRQRLVRFLRRRARPGCSSARGHEVTREYYVNDTGGQIRRLGASVLARKHGQPVPEDGYPGAVRRGPRVARTTVPTTSAAAGRWGGEQVLADIKTTLESINIHYDEWYSQASIEESGAVAETIEVLRGKGLDLRSRGRDVVAHRRLRRSPQGARLSSSRNGDVTYLAGDIAYHRNKFMIRGLRPGHRRLGRGPSGPGAEPARRGRGARRAARPARGEDRPDGLAGAGRMSKRLGTPWTCPSSSRTSVPMPLACSRLLSSVDSATTIDLDVIREQSRENPRVLRAVRACPHRVDRPGRRRARRRPIAARRRRPRAARARARARMLRTLFELPDVMQAALRRARAAQGHDVGARARRPVPRLLPRLLRDGGGRQPRAHAGSTVARRGGADRPRDRPRRARRACARLDVSGVSILPRHLLPDTSSVDARRSPVDRRLSTSSTSRPSTALRCSSTTRSTCGPAAARPSRRSARRRRSTRQGVPVPRDGRGSSHEEGLRLDVATGGELHVALAAGVPRRAPRAPRQQQERGRAAHGPDGRRRAHRRRLVRRARPSRARCTRRTALRAVGAAAGHARASRRTPTSTCRPARTTRSSGSAWPSGDAPAGGRRGRRASPVGRSRRAARPHRQPGVRGRVLRARRSRCWRRSCSDCGLPELVVGGGLGVAYVEGEEAPTLAQWARRRRTRAAEQHGITVPRRRRAGAVDRRGRGGDPLHASARSRSCPASAPTVASTAA